MLHLLRASRWSGRNWLLDPDACVPLQWCEAERVHRLAIEAFICTHPPRELWDRRRGRHHPFPWELEVQSKIHGRTPPVQLPHRMLLGFNRDALQAYISFELVEDPPGGEPPFVFVKAVACAHSARGRGYAGEAYEAMFADLSKMGWVDGFEVEANIHRLNEASKSAFEKAGGYFMEEAIANLEVWRLARPRPPRSLR
jgi:predicted GNAT superfamily acetyltransferase